jgi:hypothetical protein
MWGGHDDTTLYVHVCMGLPPFFSLILPWLHSPAGPQTPPAIEHEHTRFKKETKNLFFEKRERERKGSYII